MLRPYGLARTYPYRVPAMVGGRLLRDAGRRATVQRAAGGWRSEETMTQAEPAVAPASAGSDRLRTALATKQARVAVVGLGFAGLPQAVVIAEAGFTVTGIDVDRERVAQLARGESYITDVTAGQLQALRRTGHLRATTDPAALADADCVVVCVPTGITAERRPVLDSLEQALGTIATTLRPPALVIIESSVPPGTTRRVARLLEARLHGNDGGGRARAGERVFVAHAPERIDPGNSQYGLRETPRVVGGETAVALDLARQFYAQCGVTTVPVASVEVAELAKVFENTFRFVNISLVNELAQIATALNVSAWEVLAAASTKPYGFMPHEPGPGVGGSCIPVIPFFLADVAERLGTPSHLIAAAERVNTFMPQYVTQRAAALVGRRDDDLAGCHILVLGVTYKPDQTDCRHSPAVPVVDRLIAAGATVRVHDPLVTEAAGLHPHATFAPLTAEVVAAADLVVVVTPHRSLDYGLVIEHARCILDTRNALGDRAAPNVVPL